MKKGKQFNYDVTTFSSLSKFSLSWFDIFQQLKIYSFIVSVARVLESYSWIVTEMK